MLQQIRKMSNDQWFLLLAFVLMVILSFLFGYVAFRYWQIDICKEQIQIYK